MKILTDMDGILVNLFTYWIDAINERFGTTTRPEEVTDWDHARAYPTLRPDQVYGFLQEPGFFLHAPPLPGALEGLRALHERGHDIIIVSSPSGPTSAAEKLCWLTVHLPWLPLRNVILAQRKALVQGDVLIDDRAETLLEYRKTWPSARALGIKYPYNAHLADALDLRGSWQDTSAAWASILETLP